MRGSAAPRARPRLFDGPRDRLVLVTAAIGVGGAVVTTSTSLFLADAVGAGPLMIGLFFAGRGVAEILTDLVVGMASDRLGRRRTLLALCSASSAIGALCYLALRDYTALLVTGAFFFGIGGATFSQLFAYTREFAEFRGYNVTYFNSVLRSVTSAAWIVGPPVAFLLIASQGFTTLYLVAAALYAVAGVGCRWGLPHIGAATAPTGRARLSGALDRRLVALLVAVVLLLTVNAMYQINLALFVTKDLGLDASWPGWIIGLNALLEVPILVAVGRFADRIGKMRLLVGAAACATVFFLVLPTATSVPALLALQLPNAVWTAVVLSLPVVVIGDAMPGLLGTASSLYSAAFKAGLILGGAANGVVAAVFGFTDLFYACAGLAALATVALVASGSRRPAAVVHPDPV